MNDVSDDTLSSSLDDPECGCETFSDRLGGAAHRVAELPKRILKAGIDAGMNLLPPQAAGHFIQSNREFLLAIRSLLDAELDMADRAMQKVQRRIEPQEDVMSTKLEPLTQSTATQDLHAGWESQAP